MCFRSVCTREEIIRLDNVWATHWRGRLYMRQYSTSGAQALSRTLGRGGKRGKKTRRFMVYVADTLALAVLCCYSCFPCGIVLFFIYLFILPSGREQRGMVNTRLQQEKRLRWDSSVCLLTDQPLPHLITHLQMCAPASLSLTGVQGREGLPHRKLTDWLLIFETFT